MMEKPHRLQEVYRKCQRQGWAIEKSMGSTNTPEKVGCY